MVRDFFRSLREWRIESSLIREMMAECLGVFIMMVLGFGSGAQYVLSHGEASDWATLSLASGLSTMLGLYWAWGVSGAHINPTITIGLFSIGRLKFVKVPLYFLSQIAGAFLASVVVFFTYYDLINHSDGGIDFINGSDHTTKIFATFPNEHVSTWNLLLDSVVASAVLMGCALAATDKFNANAASGLGPFVIGLVVSCVTAAFAINGQGSINPAKDLAARLFLFITGRGPKAFSYRDYNWFWIPLLGPLVGGVLGAQLYYFGIQRHIPGVLEEAQKDLEESRKIKVVEEGFVSKDVNCDRKASVYRIPSFCDHRRYSTRIDENENIVGSENIILGMTDTTREPVQRYRRTIDVAIMPNESVNRYSRI